VRRVVAVTREERRAADTSGEDMGARTGWREAEVGAR